MQVDTEAPVPGPEADATEAGTAIRVAGVRKAFGPVLALDGLSLTVAPGEVVAVVGPSGCGKSTLLDLVCGLSSADAGTVAAAPAVLMPQRDGLLPWLDAVGNAALPLVIHGEPRPRARAAAAARFADFGLAGFERARPAELSGGMRQRVAFLRTLLAAKPVLCLDEPFASLDALTRTQMQGWLAHALELEPRTVLLVTHDVEEALLVADRVAVMCPRPGRVTAEFAVTAPRPRERTQLAPLRERVLEALGQ